MPGHRHVIALAAALMLGAAPATADQHDMPDHGDGLAGAFLAGRVALVENDFAAQATYFQRALQADPANLFFMDAAMHAQVLLGQVEKALPLAQTLLASGGQSQVAALVVQAARFAEGDYAAVLDAVETGPDTGPLTDALAPAWAQIGLGRMSEALAAFDDAIAGDLVTPFALYNKALALAMVGDFEGAHEILMGDDAGPISMGRRGVVAQLLVLGQLERFDEALELSFEQFGADVESDIEELRTAFAEGRQPAFTLIGNAREGLAEVYHVIGSALAADEDGTLPLVYARLAEFLVPDHSEAMMLSARLLEGMGQHDLADSTYARVPEGDPFFLNAEMGRAQALFEAGDPEAAIDRLRALAAQMPDDLVVLTTLGDFLRREEQFTEAIDVYERAIALIDDPERRHWVLYYTYAISLERDGRFAEAEPWFRRTLEFVPDNPSVLNYLGYSLVEERRNLDEALDMIERAVEGDPESGYITDSLGWALYRLGRYDEAVPVMERAVELMPTDPILNDHLGDVYWMVGREREARFQWRRALSFAPHPDLEVERIRRKLDVGLDVVLEEEASETGGN
ncbi:tetratricopeptide repeat protein [Rhabdonatronobacter sediminivivens]|nr:tetratricopeptide repeat protein [Rhabdonatronobacter sediminivivens]